MTAPPDDRPALSAIAAGAGDGHDRARQRSRARPTRRWARASCRSTTPGSRRSFSIWSARCSAPRGRSNWRADLVGRGDRRRRAAGRVDGKAGVAVRRARWTLRSAFRPTRSVPRSGRERTECGDSRIFRKQRERIAAVDRGAPARREEIRDSWVLTISAITRGLAKGKSVPNTMRSGARDVIERAEGLLARRERVVVPEMRSPA